MDTQKWEGAVNAERHAETSQTKHSNNSQDHRIMRRIILAAHV